MSADFRDGLLNAEGGFISVNGFVNTKSAFFASSAITISSSGALVVSASGSLNGATATQINYLSSINGGIVDLSSVQSISGIKTFTSPITFSSGFSTTSDTDLGTLTVSGLITANGGITLGNNQSISGGVLNCTYFTTTGTQVSIKPLTLVLGAGAGTTNLCGNVQWYNTGNVYYKPFAHGGLITLSQTTQNLLTSGNAGTFYSSYNLKITSATTPTLVLPDPDSNIDGQTITFIRSGITSNNAVILTTYTSSNASFLISASATNLPSFTLGSTWFKVSFMCCPNYDTTSTTWVWNQVLYQ